MSRQWSVTYIGYPNTTGLTAMDYRLTDAIADPPGTSDAYYTEQLIRLPHCFLCYQPPANLPPVNDLPAQTLGRITFGSFNNLPKLTPQVIALWSEILQAVPDSRLILKVRWFDDAPTRERYFNLFAARGIDAKRIKLIGKIDDPTHHLAFYGNIDIALDPFPYNGTTTTCEALIMGVPTLTLTGSTHANRVGHSLLTTVGLSAWVANNTEEYVNKAVAFAQDWHFLAQLRAQLRQQVLNSPLCDAVRHTRTLETTYQQLLKVKSNTGKFKVTQEKQSLQRALSDIFKPIKLEIFAQAILDNPYTFLVTAFFTNKYQEQAIKLKKSLEKTLLSFCIYRIEKVHQSISLKGEPEALDYTKASFLAAVYNDIITRDLNLQRKLSFTHFLYVDCDVVFVRNREKINFLQGLCDKGVDFAIYNWFGDKEKCTAYKPINNDLTTWTISHGNRFGYHPDFLFCSGCTQFYSLSEKSVLIWKTWQELLKQYLTRISSQEEKVFAGDDEFLDYAWNHTLKNNQEINFVWLNKEYARYPWWPWVKPFIDHPDWPNVGLAHLYNRFPQLSFNRSEPASNICGTYRNKIVSGVPYKILKEVDNREINAESREEPNNESDTNRQELLDLDIKHHQIRRSAEAEKSLSYTLEFSFKKKFNLQSAIFFISTGRCATQWLAKVLSKIYADRAVVTHEPIGPHYQPKNFFRAYDRLEKLQRIPAVEKHLTWLSSFPENKVYIETGWPCFAAIPLLCNLLEGKIKLVHLFRHPVHTSISLVTHNFYRSDIRNDDYIKLAQLDPFTLGIIQKDYQNRWEKMTPYEKCLFQWTEINLYAIELNERFREVPFLQIKMEDLLKADSEAIESLLNFLNLPFRSTIKETLDLCIDSHQHRTTLNLDWQQIFNHSGTLSLARQLGYDFKELDRKVLFERYGDETKPLYLLHKQYTQQCQSKGYQFSKDWFSQNILIWQKVLNKLVNLPNLKFLEIGSWEGRSTCWLLDNILTHESSEITCIDTFEGSIEHQNLGENFLKSVGSRFDFNIAKTGSAKKVKKIVGKSQEALRTLPLNNYDFLYIDGSHVASDVLEDAVLGWRLVKINGLIIFDDYEWSEFRDHPTQHPKLAVNNFLSVFRDRIKVIHRGYQVIIEKISADTKLNNVRNKF